MDPISVAGLTIAVLDQLWKVGERTAELVANFRDFDTESRALELKVRDENNRSRALKMLLFDPSTTYGGMTLFEQFDFEVQDQIRIFLEQASDIIDQAYHVLSRNTAKSASTSPSLSGLSIASSDTAIERPRSMQRLRWSFLDKKRVEVIVRDFSELNARIHEKIKLWCLGTSIGVSLQHLKRLEADANSQALGFDIDARLQLASSQAQQSFRSLEVKDVQLFQGLSNMDLMGEKFGVLQWRVDLDDRTRDLVDKLANLLHQRKETVFRTPSCQGWVRQIQYNRVAYLFNIPEAADPRPVSLLDSLGSSETPAPSLSQRFGLAAKLSRCISQLQLVKWVHESFRSDNILFFPPLTEKEGGTATPTCVDFTEPWVFGFEFSRPERYFSRGVADSSLARDIYRHPDRQQNPAQIFSKIHDIYALGVVLLEIGLWAPALTLEKHGFTRTHNPQAIKKQLIRQAEKRLGAKMGDKYKEIVLRCLQGSFDVVGDTKEDLKLQQAFRAQVVDVPISPIWLANSPTDPEFVPSPPLLPDPRPRALTPPGFRHDSSKNAPHALFQESCAFFRLPPNIRQDILRLAFGDSGLHMTLSYERPDAPDQVDPENHCGIANRRWARRQLRSRDPEQPKSWQWWSSVCHRLAPDASGPSSRFNREILWAHSRSEMPWADNCRNGDAANCFAWKSSDGTFACFIGAMGWLLSCRQNYAEGIEVLYATNTFMITNDPLILNLPRLLLPQRLAMIRHLEMSWQLRGAYGIERGRPVLDEAHLNDLLQVLSSHFLALRHLHVYIDGIAGVPGAEPLEPFQRCLDKFVQRKSDLETCTFFIPTYWFSCFHINELPIVEDGYKRAHNQIWRNVDDPTWVGGYIEATMVIVEPGPVDTIVMEAILEYREELSDDSSPSGDDGSTSPSATVTDSLTPGATPSTFITSTKRSSSDETSSLSSTSLNSRLPIVSLDVDQVFSGIHVTHTIGYGSPFTFSTPVPTQVGVDNHGTGQCSTSDMKSRGALRKACDTAIGEFDDDAIYTDFASRYNRLSSSILWFLSMGQAGCIIKYECDDYKVGMSDNYVSKMSGRSPSLGGGTVFHAVNTIWEENPDHALEGGGEAKGLFEGCAFKNVALVAGDDLDSDLFCTTAGNGAQCEAALGRPCEANSFDESPAPEFERGEWFDLLSGVDIPPAIPASEAITKIPSAAGNTLTLNMKKSVQAGQTAETHVSGQSNKPISRPAHALSAAQVAEELGTDTTTGLSQSDAATRLTEYGLNDLGKEKGINVMEILLAQIVNSMTLVLVLALAASFAIQAWIEGGVLAALIMINVVIGTFQDLQAARTIASLNSLNSPTAQVIRDGTSTSVDASQLVPGDIIELKVGDVVPADARLLDCINLEADEAALTGESVPARKEPDAILNGGNSENSSDDESDYDVGPGDRTNIVFSSTIVTKGRGRAVVFSTGMFTEIGAIAAALRADRAEKRQVKRDENGDASVFSYIYFGFGKVWDAAGAFLGFTVGTPLQRKLAKLFMAIFGIAVICAIIVIGANKFSSREDVIIYAIAIAVSSLPVTLILVLTISMAAGAKVMVERNVLVRNMRSLEALGGVTNICSDKTGTLTQGKMVARMAWLPGHGTYTINVSNEPYNPESGTIDFTKNPPKDIRPEENGSAITPLKESDSHGCVKSFLDVANLANLASVRKLNGEDGTLQWQAQGDPTEIAIQVLASRFGRNRETNPDFDVSAWELLAEFPFESAIKKMSVLSKSTATGEITVFTKGAVERIIDSCSELGLGTELVKMTDSHKAEILANMEALARKGFRVLALSSRPNCVSAAAFDDRKDDLKREDFERDLIFHGLVGIYDPPRPESRPSVFKCHQAGIGVHMLTGDHPETARTIATEVGILPKRMELVRADIARNMVMTAHDFDKLSDAEIDALPELPLVVARCAPSTKVRMIDALHRRGRYAAMTGDGVNDSPSLHRADIGIAMGLGGSDVAKSAADIVLSDDNFASILNAVEEGRRIFDNIQKFMLHVLALNLAFVTVMLIGLAYKDSMAISIFQVTPIEILFMLLVAGAFTETGLGFEASSPDILSRPPQSLKYGVFTPEFLIDLFSYGFVLCICLLVAFVSSMWGFEDGDFGTDCNLEYSPSCEGVFRARSTCYMVMMWVFVLFGWELIDSRRSLFDGMFSNTKEWGMRLWRNQFLFWSVVGGIIIAVPTLYIPVLNHKVFLHTGIDKEWGIVFALVIFFFIGVESYKWGKRVYLRRNNLMLRKGESLGEEDLEARTFERFYEGTISSSPSQEK
ncbi:Sodium transport ATPase 5 [Paramyrothecium foliicola]|nr:Sodium transport ATPase 5 [Paramyrothecium foliicola]